mmetsp:Transcript_2332/g.5172  ORF Transcript_2332/g.5172 Transcript_2332/m.5172 type:complete len:204 (-) Transcript_2332:713-1324(-)
MCVLVVSGSTNKRTQTTPPQASIHALFSLLVFHSMDESIRLNSVEFGSIRLVAQQTCLASIEKRNHNKNRDGRDRKIPSVSVGRSSSLFPDQISAMVKPSIIATSNPRLVDKSGLVWLGCLRRVVFAFVLGGGAGPAERRFVDFVRSRTIPTRTDPRCTRRTDKQTREQKNTKQPNKKSPQKKTIRGNLRFPSPRPGYLPRAA